MHLSEGRNAGLSLVPLLRWCETLVLTHRLACLPCWPCCGPILYLNWEVSYRSHSRETLMLRLQTPYLSSSEVLLSPLLKKKKKKFTLYRQLTKHFTPLFSPKASWSRVELSLKTKTWCLPGWHLQQSTEFPYTWKLSTLRGFGGFWHLLSGCLPCV